MPMSSLSLDSPYVSAAMPTTAALRTLARWACLSMLLLPGLAVQAQSGPPIKVGVIHSLTGGQAGIGAR